MIKAKLSGDSWAGSKLFIASFLALYFELLIIRYLSTEIRTFAYLKNVPLIASFLGIGLGMMLGSPRKPLLRIFPFVAAALFLVIRYASFLQLTRVGIQSGDYLVFGSYSAMQAPAILLVLRYLGVVIGITGLVVTFLLVIGGIVGQYFAEMPPLRGYAINLSGSLAGVLLFTSMAYWELSPAWWLAVGMAFLLPLLPRRPIPIAILVLTTLAVAVPQPSTFWSPYYRVELQSSASPPHWRFPSAYYLNVNHDYHQKIVDLSASFLSANPAAEPNRSAFAAYEIPYWLAPQAGDVLIVGAGTGNDVAAALRHGAQHVDAVEIDPVIVNIGRKFHPEHPYDSPKVTVFVDDARSFFRKTRKHYDLVIFGYLDSHTLLTGFSSLRLDNYVYTVESFQEARQLLKPSGTVVLAFAGGKTFLTKRLYSTLERAFGVPPRAYAVGYDTSGVVFVEGAGRSSQLTDVPEISEELQNSKRELVATDSWPFLYLKTRTIPVSILIVLVTFLIGSRRLLRYTIGLPWGVNRQYAQMFFLGAGFLLLETKSVTQLSLLFGSTWLVNAVVISAFLSVALLANLLVAVRRIPPKLAYVGLFVSLFASVLYPLAGLAGSPPLEKFLGAGIIAALPVFFSGLIFSESFSHARSASHALGVNLLGAMVGGILENLVMIGGTTILGALAVVLYGASAICARSEQRELVPGFIRATEPRRISAPSPG